MSKTTETLTCILPIGYNDHFKISEYKFRWIDALGIDRDKSRPEHHVACTLASMMDTEGYAYPSIDHLARCMASSNRFVQNAIRSLADKGWLIVDERSGTSNEYQAILPQQGLNNLVAHREGKRSGAKSFPARIALANRLLETVWNELNFDKSILHSQEGVKRLCGAIRQILSNSPDPESDGKRMVRSLCESPSPKIQDPVSYLFNRIKTFRRENPHLGRQRDSSTGGSIELKELVAQATRNLPNLQRELAKPMPPKSAAWSKRKRLELGGQEK